VAVADTVEWLDHHSIPYRDLCFLGEKPQVDAHAYVDDAPHNIEALRSSGAEAVVFSQRYNSEVAGPRAAGWSEVEDWVLSVMAASGHTVQPTIPLGIDRSRGPVGEIR
jgi:5'(3')-deoxyribonucleotidase